MNLICSITSETIYTYFDFYLEEEKTEKEVEYLKIYWVTSAAKLHSNSKS